MIESHRNGTHYDAPHCIVKLQTSVRSCPARHYMHCIFGCAGRVRAPSYSHCTPQYALLSGVLWALIYVGQSGALHAPGTNIWRTPRRHDALVTSLRMRAATSLKMHFATHFPKRVTKQCLLRLQYERTINDRRTGTAASAPSNSHCSFVLAAPLVFALPLVLALHPKSDAISHPRNSSVVRAALRL